MHSAAIKQALLDSYTRDGGINHLDEPNLPGQGAVAEIAQDFVHLLFPGYFEKGGLPKAEVPAWLDKMLAHLNTRLIAETEKCLRFAHDSDPAANARRITGELLAQLPVVRRVVQSDVAAAYAGDPAARSVEEIIVAYPCVLVISLQRIAHVLHGLNVPLLPRMLTEYGHERTGVDIHPGAKIGSHFFIDHGTGVVIGETATIGDHVKIYQGVTLGAKSFVNDESGQPVKGLKRHPDIESHVTIYAHATILGGDTRVGTRSVVGASVWLLKSIPPDSLAYYQNASLVVRPKRKEEISIASAGPGDWMI